MAILNFPTNPALDQTYIANNVIYTWNGEYWEANSTNGFDSRYVEVSGDNMTGDLTLGTDKITLDATDGNIIASSRVSVAENSDADFTKDIGIISVNSDGSSTWQQNTTLVKNFIQCYKGPASAGGAQVFSVETDGSIISAGSATFASSLQTGDQFLNNAGSGGSYLYGSGGYGGGVLIYKSTDVSSPIDQDANAFIKGYSAPDSLTAKTQKFKIDADGSAEFVSGTADVPGVFIHKNNSNGAYPSLYLQQDNPNGNFLTCKNGFTGALTATIQANGSADFAQRILVGGDLNLNPSDTVLLAYDNTAGGSKTQLFARGDARFGIGVGSFGNDTSGVYVEGSTGTMIVTKNQTATTGTAANVWRSGRYDLGETITMTADGQIISNNVITSATLSGTGTRPVYCDSSGGLTIAASDRKLKRNIKALPSQVEQVKALNPVSFNWINKEKLGDGIEVGFIAQEVEKVVPEVVRLNADGTLALDYSKLTATLTSALQTALTRIEALEAKVASLENPTSTADI